jgi:RNA polymerase sigma-70 factor, ECF subfamily
VNLRWRNVGHFSREKISPVMSEEADRSERKHLMESAQRGDREAFLTLMRNIGPMLTGFLRRRVADPNELEDVCQETLIAIYESRHTYQPTRPVEPWIFAIARHVAANHYRRHKTRTRWQELLDELPDRAHDMMENEASCMVRFRQALGQLPAFQREAFVMTKIDGLSLLEASERTGASVGTLKVRVHRAYDFLKRSIVG